MCLKKKRSRLNFSKCQDLTAIFTEAKEGKEESIYKVILPPRKHITFEKKQQTYTTLKKTIYAEPFKNIMTKANSLLLKISHLLLGGGGT